MGKIPTPGDNNWVKRIITEDRATSRLIKFLVCSFVSQVAANKHRPWWIAHFGCCHQRRLFHWQLSLQIKTVKMLMRMTISMSSCIRPSHLVCRVVWATTFSPSSGFNFKVACDVKLSLCEMTTRADWAVLCSLTVEGLKVRLWPAENVAH